MENKELLDKIYDLYDAYIKKVDELERNKKFTAGLLGLTKGPKDDPCHDEFAKDLAERIDEFAAADPDPEEVRVLLEYMYAVPLKHRDSNMIYWMFAAVHSLTAGLIPHLKKEDAEKIYQQYNTDYPRWERLPAQKNVLKVLKAMI